MYVRKDEAYKMICPNLIGATPGQRACEGARCMAWRWIWEYVDAEGESKQTDNGYCGLAGVPME